MIINIVCMLLDSVQCSVHHYQCRKGTGYCLEIHIQCTLYEATVSVEVAQVSRIALGYSGMT